MSSAAILWLVASIPVFLGAASLSRLYVATDRTGFLLAMLALYGIGNLMMVKLMRESGLGLAIATSSVAQLVFVSLIAVFLFDERLSTQQTVGLVLGVAALALMMWPARAT